MSWPVPERREHLTRLYLARVPFRLIAEEYGGTPQGVRSTVRKMVERGELCASSRSSAATARQSQCKPPAPLLENENDKCSQQRKDKGMSRYLDFWDAVLKPFGRCAWRNPNYLFGVQIIRRIRG